MEELTLTKEQTVSELFALRAGLSKISDYTNEIVAEEKAISDRQASEISARKNHEQTVQNVCNEEVAIETQTAEKIEQIRDDAWSLGEFGLSADSADFGEFSESTFESAKNSIENSVTNVEKTKKLFSILSIIFWILVCIGNPIIIITEIIICVTVHQTAQIMRILIPLSVVSFIVACIISNCDKKGKITAYKKKRKAYEKYVEDMRVRNMKLKNLGKWYVQAKATKIVECEKTIKEAQNKRDEALKAEESRFNCEIAELTEKNEKANEASREKIRVVSEKSASIDRAMTEQYPWISKSDWGNVDMIIYYIQTGRADTLKEALYQVDRQLQTDQIVNAVKESAAFVGRTINETLNRNFYVMSSIVRESTESIGAGLNSINRSARHILSSIDSLADKVEESAQGYARLAARQAALQGELLDAAQLNSALLEKSNSTSQELLNDLRYQQRYWVN